MNIIDIVRSAAGGHGLEKLARSYGLEPVQLEALLVTVVPTISQRLEANTLSRGGVADLLAQVTRPEHSYLLEHPDAAAQPWAQEAGIGVLDTVFGDKAKSRALAARAASQTGVDQGLIQKLLPILASLVMGALAKGSQGGLQDILKRLPDLAGGQTGGASTGGGRGGRPRVPSDEGEATGGLGDILSRIPGMPGPAGGNDGGFPLPGERRAGGGRTGDWDTPRQGSGGPIPG
ncbi:MAG: DUF937 domain-containing protein, partial [Hyphomicrobiaceae bacterium]|nr:DUF937 domain-containing protein [Hyphomicrobiaceae bacterium]